MGKETALPRQGARTPAPSAAPFAAPSTGARAPGPAALLRLQQGMGNAAVTQMLARTTVESQNRDLPRFSQDGWNSCGAASLLTQIMVWDRQFPDPDRPHGIVVDACDALMSYLEKHPSVESRLSGQSHHVLSAIARVRSDAATGGEVTQTHFADLAWAMMMIFGDSGGLNAGETSEIRRALGFGTHNLEKAPTDSLDSVFDTSVVKNLKPGNAAHGMWTGDSEAHAFLIGRFDTGNWYMVDTGPNPSVELEHPTRAGLAQATLAAARSGVSLLDPIRVDGPVVGGAVKLKGHWAVERAGRGIGEGEHLAEVDAGWRTMGEDIHCEYFHSKHASADDAEAEWKRIPDAVGGVIHERPRGVFSLYLTNTVSEANLHETSIESGIGVLGKRRFYHAWMMLCTADGRYRSKFQLY